MIRELTAAAYHRSMSVKYFDHAVQLSKQNKLIPGKRRVKCGEKKRTKNTPYSKTSSKPRYGQNMAIRTKTHVLYDIDGNTGIFY
jgi:hypothetical protein